MTTFRCTCDYSDSVHCFLTQLQCSATNLTYIPNSVAPIIGLCYNLSTVLCSTLVNDNAVIKYNDLLNSIDVRNIFISIHVYFVGIIYGAMILRNNWYSFHKDPPETNKCIELILEISVNTLPTFVLFIYSNHYKSPLPMNFSHIVMGLALLFMIQLQSLFSNRIFPIKPYSSYRISEILSFITSLFYCLTISILTNSDTIRTYLPLCSLLMCIVPCLINYHFKRQYLPLSNLDLPNQDLQTKPGLLHNLKKPKLLVRQRVIDDEESALYNKKQFDDNTQNPIQRSLADQRLLVNESVLNEPIRQAFIRNENERPNNQSFNKELELQSPVHLLNRDVDAGKHSELSTIRQSSEEFVKLIRPVIVHNTLQQGSFNSQKADLENVKLIKPTILRNTTHQSSFTCENFQNPIQRADEEIVKLIIPAIIRNTTHQGSFKRRSEADNLQNPIQKIISLI